MAAPVASARPPKPPVGALHVEVSGLSRPGARTLVLVHGNFDCLETWSRLAPLLASSFRVVTLDLPGFGRSPNTDGAYGVDTLAASLLGALDAARVRRAVLVGNSLGGAVVSAFAAAHPERVEALVLEDANLVPSTSDGPMAGALMTLWSAAQAAQADDEPAASLALLAALERALAMALPSPGAIDAERVATFARAFDREHWPELVRQRGAFSLQGLQERLVAARARTPFPILALWGTEDPLVPESALERALPRLLGARAVFFAATGHAPHLERPREMAELLHEVFVAPGPPRLPDEDRLVVASDAPLPEHTPLERPRLAAAVARARVSLWRTRCAQAREPRACAEAARALLDGDGVAPDSAAGLAAASIACSGGQHDACLRLRDQDGAWTERLERALRSRALADCQRGDGPACERVRVLGFEGPEANDERAWLAARSSALCRQGTASACATAGRLQARAEGGGEGRDAAALSFGAGCELGHGASCLELGAMLLDGYAPRADGSYDTPRAFDLLKRACEAGSARGCTLAGLRDPSRSPREAFFRLSRGCLLGDGPACAELGMNAEGGRGTLRDPEEAARLYARACALGAPEACKQGEALAARPESRRRWRAETEPRCRGKGPITEPRTALECWAVALSYLEDDGRPRDERRAAALLARTCDVRAATGVGCADLAELIGYGRGVRRDAELALRLDRASCERDGGACVRAGLALASTQPEEAEALLRRVLLPEHKLALARALMAGAPELRPGVYLSPPILLESACLGGNGEACVILYEL